jgi:hypothetical protein
MCSITASLDLVDLAVYNTVGTDDSISMVDDAAPFGVGTFTATPQKEKVEEHSDDACSKDSETIHSETNSAVTSVPSSRRSSFRMSIESLMGKKKVKDKSIISADQF